MDRRQLIQNIALLTGGTFIGGELLLTAGCKTVDKDKVAISKLFAEKDLELLNEIGETILPATKTPGAKAANVAQTMQVLITDCYEEKDQKIFTEGIKKLNEDFKTAYKTDFISGVAQQRTAFLTKLDKDAKAYMETKKPDNPSHYFIMLKQLVLFTFFTSKEGCTQVLRYVAVPGRYEANVEYKKGDRAWATN